MTSIGVSTRRGDAFRRLIWLMPLAYGAHIVEEVAGGFSAWVGAAVGGHMSGPAFAANNAVFMAILIALVAWASRTRSASAAFVLILGSSALLFWDFLFHLGMTAALDRYSPGVVTGALFYYPLSIAVAWATLSERVLRPATLAAATVLGAAVLAVAIWGGMFGFAGLA